MESERLVAVLGPERLARLRTVEVELINESAWVIRKPHEPGSTTQSSGVLRAYTGFLFRGLLLLG